MGKNDLGTFTKNTTGIRIVIPTYIREIIIYSYYDSGSKTLYLCIYNHYIILNSIIPAHFYVYYNGTGAPKDARKGCGGTQRVNSFSISFFALVS